MQLNPPLQAAILRDDKAFRVKDVAVNCVFAAGWWELGLLAVVAGDNALAATCRAAANRTATAVLAKMRGPLPGESNDGFAALYRDASGDERALPRATIQELFPLLLPPELVPAATVASLVAMLRNESRYWLPYPVPTVPADSPAFAPAFSAADDLMWRGPTWGFTNWFLLEGLEKHGYHAEHAALLDRWVALVEGGGIWEMYNPINGKGTGAVGLGMSTLLVDWLYRTGRFPPPRP